MLTKDHLRYDLLTVQLVLSNFNSSKIDKKLLRGFFIQFKIHSDFSCVPISFRQTEINLVCDVCDERVPVICNNFLNMLINFVCAVLVDLIILFLHNIIIFNLYTLKSLND